MQLRPYQQEAIDVIQAQPPGSYLIQMATGLGKCLGRGTPVLMFDGSIKPVESIQEGELVMGPDSGPRRVVGLASGVSELYKVTPKKGEPYIVNEGHILSLKITGMKPGKSVCTADKRRFHGGDICNISVNDYMASSKTFKHVAKGWRTSIDFERKPVLIPPYILGIWLGDGTAATTNITTMEPEVVRELHGYAFRNGLTLSVVNSGGTGKALTYSVSNKRSHEHGANTMRAALKEYKILGDKDIPSDYLINDRETRLELLAGLIDSDGFLIDKSVYEIVTVKEKMKTGILYLARSLGFASYCSIKTVDGGTYYRIFISGDTSLIPTRVDRRKASPRKQKKNVLVTGIQVEPIGQGEYFGFELEGPDRLFVLGDFTVTHNTVTFSSIPRQGRVLLLSHREELVNQPRKYYDCSFGIERAGGKSNGEEVVSASVQTLVRRLDRFAPDAFDMIITDECHHAAAGTYRKIYEHFKPRLHLGFTATPNRGDKVRLDDVFQEIIFSRDLRWGIQQGYLCDILCKRVEIGYDLSKVHTRMGDYAPGELAEAMEGTADAIAQTYREHAEGATLIFAVNVAQAEEIASKIPGSVAVTGQTKDRHEIIQRFTDGEIQCLVNVMVFTEGTDIPKVETVIIARPTQSDSLYAQMVGRGLRLWPGKEKLILIDCVGTTGRASLCTAPSLLGLDMVGVPKRKLSEIDGMLFDLPTKIAAASDTPESWIRNVEIVDLWAKEQKYQTHDVNWFKMPDGSMVCSLPNKRKFTISCPDSLGMVDFMYRKMPMQEALDSAYRMLCEDHESTRYIWDLNVAKRWGKQLASEAQLRSIQRRCKGYDTTGLTKGQASQILNRLFNGGKGA